MDQTTILRARLLAALVCRVVDYHAVRTSQIKAAPDEIAMKIGAAEKAVAVALENVIDQGAIQ